MICKAGDVLNVKLRIFFYVYPFSSNYYTTALLILELVELWEYMLKKAVVTPITIKLGLGT